MNNEIDMKMNEKYESMTDYLAEIVRDKQNATEIFWMLTGSLVKECDLSVDGTDIFGIMRNKVIGWESRSEDEHIMIVYNLDKREKEQYDEFFKTYELSSKLNELGNFWKELITTQKFSRLKRMYAWIEMYQKDWIPYFEDVILNILTEWNQSSNEKSDEINKVFKSAKKDMKELQKKLLVICEVINMEVEEV